MQINEQELAEAVERLREGEQVMGINADNVLISMMNDLVFRNEVVARLYCLDEPQEYFEEKFNEAAADLLREAYRTKLEHEAGL